MDPKSGRPRLPVICALVFSISLGLCFLRGGWMLIEAIYSTSNAQREIIPSGRASAPPAPPMAYVLQSSNLAIIAFGVPANVLLLARQRIGLLFGWTFWIAVFCSICLVLYQLMQMEYADPFGSVVSHDVRTVARVVAFARVLLLFTYAFALIQFSIDDS